MFFPTPSPARTVVCLCGSTRFWQTFQEASLRETLAGKIVLSIGAASGHDDSHFSALDDEARQWVKAGLDVLHYAKIDLADEVLVLNVGGYVGESTRREVLYAHHKGKPVRWWEPDAIPPGYTGVLASYASGLLQGAPLGDLP